MEKIKEMEQVCLVEEHIKDAKKKGDPTPIIAVSCPCSKCTIKC